MLRCFHISFFHHYACNQVWELTAGYAHTEISLLTFSTFPTLMFMYVGQDFPSLDHQTHLFIYQIKIGVGFDVCPSYLSEVLGLVIHDLECYSSLKNTCFRNLCTVLQIWLLSLYVGWRLIDMIGKAADVFYFVCGAKG